MPGRDRLVISALHIEESFFVFFEIWSISKTS